MIEELRKGPLFARLTPEQLERVAARARRVSLHDGQALFEQGDRAERFFLVLRGQAKLFLLSPDGNEKVIDIVSAGNTFAEALMFLDRPRYPVGATALGPVELLAIDSRDFLSMLRGSVDTCLLLLGDMSQRLRRLIHEIDELSLRSATCRVAAYLLHIAPEEVDRFRLEVPKGVVASRLSVKPETFSRIIKTLSQEGILSVHGSEVRIHDRGALRARASTCPPPRLGAPTATL